MADGTKDELLARLRSLGPLPADAAVTQDQLDEFGDVVDRIGAAPPDPAYVRPLLGAFGPGDGFGLYTHGVWALLRQDRAAVAAAALDALADGPDGSRQWALTTLGRMREAGDHTPPTTRELELVEGALLGSSLVAEAAVWYAYWLGGEEGRRLLGVAAREATGEARERAVELLGHS
jgi:hypothetical protein